MFRSLEDFVAGADLDNLAEIHDGHPVRDVAHNRQFMGYEDHCEPVRFAKIKK